MSNAAPTSTLTPPLAKKIEHKTEIHGQTLLDPYFWLREKENPEVIAHLNAENAFTDATLKDMDQIKADLFEEMKARIKEDDSEVPYRKGDHYYYVRMIPGQQYALYCRKHLSLEAPEEILLDGNKLAEGQKFFSLGVFEVSPAQDWLAYSVDFDGSEKYSIYFKNLKTNVLLPTSIPGAAHSLEWANDNQTIFYSMLDEHERPDRVLRHTLGTDPAQDKLIYKEEDAQLFVYCSKSKSDRYLFIDLHGKVTSEIHFLDADTPTEDFQVIEPRKRGVLYSLAHHDERFFILTNDTVQNFRLAETPTQTPSAKNWKTIKEGSAQLFLEDVEAFKNHLVIEERENGLPQIRILDLKDMSEHLIEFPEPAYDVGTHSNPEFNTETLRFSYTSLVTPNTVFDYDMRQRTRETKKTQEIPSGYDRTLYKSERVYATSADGTKIPISLVYRADKFKRDGSSPLYLYGYGSYGISIDASFGTTRLSLLNRGFVFAIAHIRGGSEMGRQWYDDAKFLTKKNTFTDFIASAEHLIKEKFTSQGEIAICGGSAGGMLVGNVINQRPELFKAAIAKVPFVDVINTMLDETLPLTVTEFEEWGNPKDPVYFKYMLEYSPYDNVKKQGYPHLLITSGLNDPRVTYWEPAKWVAKLREMKTNQNLLLQHINMDAGHGGASGRYEVLKEIALEFVFILKVFGVTA
jgi:oligopeptidase B